MATSGTVGNTVINTAKVIEHAIRRCGLPPTSITSETVETSKQCLYLLILGLANRGLNLWCLETQYIGLERGKVAYNLNKGTMNVLSLYLSKPYRNPVALSNIVANEYFVSLDDSVSTLRIGLKFNSISSSETVSISSSEDNLSWSIVKQIARTDWESNRWYWIPLDPPIAQSYIKISVSSPSIDIDDEGFYAVSSLFDYEMMAFNRDDYLSLPNKQIIGTPTNYYLERKISPSVSIWPTPSEDTNHLTAYCYRQIQDVGTITDEIEIPSRWFEAIIWQLSERLCFELPGIEPTRLQYVSGMASRHLTDVENEETDSTPLRIVPRIGAYTR